MSENDLNFITRILELVSPLIFSFGVIMFNQNNENVRWSKNSFIKRKQEVYIDYYDKILDIKNNLSFIISEFFIYNATRSSDTVPDNLNNWDDHIDFDHERNRLSEEINKILNIFKEYSFSYEKFMVYFNNTQIPNINVDKLNHFISGLGTVEAHIMDLNFTCIAKTENQSDYYYPIDDFNWRLNKIRCSGKSILNALNDSGLIDYLEKELII